MRRRLALALVAGAALASVAPAANASLTCPDLGPVPGYGPVCTVRCVLGHEGNVNIKDPVGTLHSLVVIMCPA